MSGLAIETLEFGILSVKLDRPSAANALDSALQAALVETLERAAGDPAIRAVLLAATSGRVFSTGADLKEFSDLPAAEVGERRRTLLVRTLMALLDFPKPLVAAVRGKAIGAGLMLALSADEAVFADGATLSMPEIRLQMPSPIGIALLMARSGREAAYRLMQAAEAMDAETARRLGLADEVIRADEVQAAALCRAVERAGLEGAAFAANKAWINRPCRDALRAAADEAKRLHDLRFQGKPA